MLAADGKSQGLLPGDHLSRSSWPANAELTTELEALSDTVLLALRIMDYVGASPYRQEGRMAVCRLRWLGGTVGLLSAAMLAWSPQQAKAGDVLVFAAASLKTALDDVSAQWHKETGKTARISYAGSSALAKQIDHGAPADIFISADLAWMDYLAKKNLIKPETRSNLLGNRIVLVAPKDKAQPVEIKPGFDLAGLLSEGRLAIANVQSVPAGRYGKAALTKLGVWESVAGKLAEAENVRAALLLVSRGEVPAGIVYQTDAAADKSVAIIGTFPDDTHPPIIYPMAMTTGSANQDAAGFLAYLRSAKARPMFEAQGFAALAPGQS